METYSSVHALPAMGFFLTALTLTCSILSRPASALFEGTGGLSQDTCSPSLLDRLVQGCGVEPSFRDRVAKWNTTIFVSLFTCLAAAWLLKSRRDKDRAKSSSLVSPQSFAGDENAGKMNFELHLK